MALRQAFSFAGERSSNWRMTTHDQQTGLPELDFKSDDRAVFSASPADPAILSALTLRALTHYASALATGGEAKLVSVSVDVTGTGFDGGAGEVSSQVDRQTRTLLFMGADLTSGAGLHLKATAIFRTDPL